MTKTILAVSLVAILGGCASANVVHEDLPPASVMRDVVNMSGKIDVYKDGYMPKRPVVRIAKIGAHGNGYANNQTLQAKMEQAALAMGADCLVITNGEVTKDETFGTYGGGIWMSDQIRRPHLYGITCKYSQVRLGVQADSKTGVIQYVTADSPAARAGIVEGQKLLAVNGIPYGGDNAILETEVSTKRPGDVVIIEVLNKEGVKESKKITLTGI